MIQILNIPQLAPSLNGNKGLIRLHYQQYKKVKENWIWLIRAEPFDKVEGSCKVQINRYYASQPLDIDNLYAACKVPLDALQRAGVIRDDNPDIVTALTCRQFKVSKKIEQRTEIIITE